MPRPFRCRRIEQLPVYRSFSPDDITAAESVQMTVDEYEALRLLDNEGLTQEACADRMNIARTTVTAIYDSARKKVADAIVKLQSKEDTTIPALREQLKECEKGIENMLNAIQAGVLTPSTKERLDQLEARRSDLNISIMQAELIRPKYTKQQIVEWISQFKHGDPNDLNYQKQIIDIFLNSIYVYDDRCVFTYNFHGGTETIPREAVEEAFGSDLTRLAPHE